MVLTMTALRQWRTFGLRGQFVLWRMVSVGIPLPTGFCWRNVDWTCTPPVLYAWLAICASKQAGSLPMVNEPQAARIARTT
jgi:hypothetical protein